MIAQKSAYSPRARILSIHSDRFCDDGSARNARTSSGVGSVPMASRKARRRNVESSASGLGIRLSAFHFACTSSSTKFRTGTSGQFAAAAEAGRGMVIRQTSIRPM